MLRDVPHRVQLPGSGCGLYVIFSSSCATCSTRASVDRVAIRWMPMDRCVYMNRERKGCHIHSEQVRAFSPCYAPVPGCDKFRLVLPMFSCRYVDEIQKLSRPFKYATPFPRGLSRVDVAERLFVFVCVVSAVTLLGRPGCSSQLGRPVNSFPSAR